MRRILAIALLAVSVSIGVSAPEKPWFPQTLALPPHTVAHHGCECEPGDPVLAIASGSGASAVGLYLFNGTGQCVAWDDVNTGNVNDDRVLTFTPADIGPYDVEVRNLGPTSNQVDAAFRGTRPAAAAKEEER